LAVLPSDVVLLAPPSPPLPGHVVVAYEVLPSEGGCSCDLNFVGIITMIVLLLCFFPLAWIPCVVPECQRKYARPVYGFPPPPGAVVVPVGAVPQQPQQPQPQPQPQPQQPQQQTPYVPMTTAQVGGAGPSSSAAQAPPAPAKEV
jgi:hypothetical protein